MQTHNHTEFIGQYKMLPPEPRTFQDREELVTYVRDFGASQGYVVTIKKSRKDKRVILGCDRGGVYRNRCKIDESQRKRKACSRLINCPFEAIGKKEDDAWVLVVRNGEHNHEPLKDTSEHPYNRRFSEEEVRQIKMMTEAGIKPRQVLKALKQSNPELQSTPRHLYNLKAKIRQGNLSEKNLTSWTPDRFIAVNSSTDSASGSLKQKNQPQKVCNFIDGKFVESHSSTSIEVINPATQEVVSHVPFTTYEEFKDAVIAAKRAFPSWKNTPITTRQRIMFKLQELIRRDMDKLAMNITIEQGKTLKGSQGDLLRGLEVVEHACGMAALQMGEFVPNASNGIDTFCIREPLGVCAGICPFNFPATMPLWMFPIAITCGNTFVLKPCEKNPGASAILAELAKEAGLPDGVLNIIHGNSDIVNYVCDDEDIKALSFIGSDVAGMHIYARAAARGKRVQSMIGGKNHSVILPDASMDDTLNAVVAAGFGAAGQRCMALSTVVFVGGSMPWENGLVERVKALKVNAGTDPCADLGPVISKEVKDRINRLVQSAVDSGARLHLDGRNILVPGYEKGSFIGPTILCDVTINMDCYKEEIFGPVLLCMQADSLEEAIAIINKNRYGNGASIFTASGVAARKFQNDVDAGMVGVNIPIPIPLPFSTWHEPKASFAGDLIFCGKAGVQFYTQIKTVAQQWRDLPSLGVSLSTLTHFEMETGNRRVSLGAPPSERDSPSERVSPAVSVASERDSPRQRAFLHEDLPNSGVTSLHSITDEDLHSQGASLVLPPTAEQDLPDNNASFSILSASNSSHETALTMSQSSDSVYIPRTSRWNDTSSLSSQRTESISSTSMGIYMSASQRNGNVRSSTKRNESAFSLASECLYVSTSHGNENIVSSSHRTNNAVHPASEKLYDIIANPTHLNDRLSQTFQRRNSIFPPPESRYIPSTSHKSDQISPASQRPDAISSPNSKRIYIARVPDQRTENMNPASQRNAAMQSTSEAVYTPQMVQRINTTVAASERLYLAPTTERVYNDSTMVSIDSFPSHGTSMNLSASQRM
ncbi:hypothetical protein K2173_026097 [Erythroxylum novogranatense]|uniref:methylmalonate-semialdehyde dehydrogenase (CoA acylating) n=1 Tax=Erythroxylum novogranatense TaxID=1862640 RepID=A0AAV8TZW9_9ROSI|nr:hypothetical protein K2173_026097 [Erythroxylum novogranatense]